MVFTEKYINITENAIAFPLPCPVANFLGNDEVFIVVLYCSLEFIKSAISNAEIAIGFAFTCPVTNFLGNDEAFIGLLLFGIHESRYK